MDGDVEWSRLPTLCVSAILHQLPYRDAVAASSVCKNWRAALAFYSGEKTALHLIAYDYEFDRNCFLTQMFRKNLRTLSVVLQSHGRQLDKFIHLVLMRFCEAKALESVEFFALRKYFLHEDQASVESLRKVMCEPLLQSQKHSLRRIVFHGCGSLMPEGLQDPEESLDYINLRCVAATSVRSGMNLPPVHLFPFSSLQLVAMDYCYLDEFAMKALSSLPYLIGLVLNVCSVREQASPIDWSELSRYYDKTTEVTVNLIHLSVSEIELFKHYVLTPDLCLTVIRIFFCGHLNLGLIKIIRDTYCDSIREFQYVDCPATSIDDYYDPLMRPGHFINQFVMMCWKCVNLQTLVIHGYWVDPYDLLGMVRLRSKTLRRLEVSALLWDGPQRLLFQPVTMQNPPVDQWSMLFEEINSMLSFNWNMVPQEELHPALTHLSDEPERLEYILVETFVDTVATLPNIT